MNEKPGWGIEIDEVAAKYPFIDSSNHLNGGWADQEGWNSDCNSHSYSAGS